MKLFQGAFQFNEIYAGWWPQLLILNEIGSGALNAISIKISANGTVRFKEQRNVTLETPMRLKRFPFDTQVLKAHMIPFSDHKDEVVLVVDERVLGATENYAANNEEVNIAQWKLLSLDLVSTNSELRYYGEQNDFSEIELKITLERKSSNMIWKVIFPLVVLVLMMWAVFWLEVDNLSDRLNLAFIGILTIVAYQFLIDGAMPRISYFTFTDAVLLYSFLVMCLAIFESLILYSLCKAGRKHSAERVDVIFQWMFPVIYFGGLILSYIYYLKP